MVGKDNPALTPERRFATNEFFIYFDGQSRCRRKHYFSLPVPRQRAWEVIELVYLLANTEKD